MRIITWNINSANRESPVWKLLLELDPDIVLLQEVGSIPDKIKNVYNILSKKAVKKTGKPQYFSTTVLVKGKIIKEISLSSEYDWVNRELEFFKGNLISCRIQPINFEPINVVSVLSPYWYLDKNRLEGIDVSAVKLKSNPEIWVTEIIWSALKNMVLNNETWIIGGDYNCSETFDYTCSSGNKEILDRMFDLGFRECLREYNDRLVPTFQNSIGKKVIHQIDHLFVTKNLYPLLSKCETCNQSEIFGKSLSDHLPIIADFRDR